jgi:hypothetical protein
MLGLASALLDPPHWRLLLDAPIRWISQGTIDPELERTLEDLELFVLGLVVSLIAVIVWDVSSSRAREQARRAGQVQWRRRLHERKRRLGFEPKGQNGGRLGPTR